MPPAPELFAADDFVDEYREAKPVRFKSFAHPLQQRSVANMNRSAQCVPEQIAINVVDEIGSVFRQIR